MYFESRIITHIFDQVLIKLGVTLIYGVCEPWRINVNLWLIDCRRNLVLRIFHDFLSIVDFTR
jgi:hypothetical protein